jgi:hypothetical protein
MRTRSPFKPTIILTAWIGLALTTGCRSEPPAPPQTSPATAAPASTPRVYAVTDDTSSTIYIRPAGATQAHRFTPNTHAWESDPVLSPSGKLVAYATADGPEARSEVWLAHLDGTHAHRVSAPDQDAVLPAFALDEKTLLYVISRFNGHYSPIARPRRHKFDIVKTLIDPDAPIPGASPIELTQQNFFDMRSLNVSPDGEHFIVATSGYPIGSLIEEFEISHPLAIHKIFQPHVPSEPSSGAEFGSAAFSTDGMSIIFTAATEGKDGMFNYNVYSMSDVTGGDIAKLADHTGVIDRLDVAADGTVYFSGAGKRFSLNPATKLVNPE